MTRRQRLWRFFNRHEMDDAMEAINTLPSDANVLDAVPKPEEFEDIALMLLRAFYWAETPQGALFWMDVVRKINNIKEDKQKEAVK